MGESGECVVVVWIEPVWEERGPDLAAGAADLFVLDLRLLLLKGTLSLLLLKAGLDPVWRAWVRRDCAQGFIIFVAPTNWASFSFFSSSVSGLISSVDSAKFCGAGANVGMSNGGVCCKGQRGQRSCLVAGAGGMVLAGLGGAELLATAGEERLGGKEERALDYGECIAGQRTGGGWTKVDKLLALQREGLQTSAVRGGRIVVVVAVAVAVRGSAGSSPRRRSG